MDDVAILELYREHSEEAIRETEKKYGKYCYSIAYGILGNHEDSEECVNDAFVRLWDSIIKQKPKNLRMYLAKITRNLTINRYRELTREAGGYVFYYNYYGKNMHDIFPAFGFSPIPDKTPPIGFD